MGKYIPMEWQSYFLAIVGGIFLHISAVIIFESNKNHKWIGREAPASSVRILIALLGHLYSIIIKD